jgi:ribulose-5-phosphate 4-epimerase/fuculose-1-phosphate aldolase
VIHGAIHNARPDVHCVIHTHTRAGAGVSAQEDGLLPLSQHAAMLIGRIGYHDFEGIAVREDEQERLVRNLGAHSILVLRNHGLLTAGRTASEAFYLMVTLERACEIQIAALTAGARVRHITPEAIAATQTVYDRRPGFSRDWSAMLRLLDRIAPDYKN